MSQASVFTELLNKTNLQIQDILDYFSYDPNSEFPKNDPPTLPYIYFKDIPWTVTYEQGNCVTIKVNGRFLGGRIFRGTEYSLALWYMFDIVVITGILDNKLEQK
jgi:hypothetical protein